MFGIVIPVYRGGKYLADLIDSLIAESDSNWEAIIVDDSNSNRVTIELLRLCLDSRFTVIKNDANLGPFISWNIGLKELIKRRKYRLISIVHEDDLLHVDYVKNSFSYLFRFPDVDIFHSRVNLIGDSGMRKFSFPDYYKFVGLQNLNREVVVTHSDTGLARILKKNFVFCPTMIFNVEKFNRLRFAERWEMVGDLDFISSALIEGRIFLQLPDKNYFYRRHENNLTSELTRTTKRFEEEINLYREIETRCRRVGFYKSALAAKKARIIKLHILYRMMISLFRFDFASFRRLCNVRSTIGK